MGKTIWLVLGAIILIAGGALWWSSQTPTPVPAPVEQGASSPAAQDTSGTPPTTDNTNTTVTTVTTVTTKNAPPMSATVTYNGSAFSPATVTIAKGGTVKFVDSAGSSMWVASNQHPSHTGYDGSSRSQHCAAGYSGPAPFDQCAGGASFSFTFAQTGTWGYHDHMNASAGGTVIVQ